MPFGIVACTFSDNVSWNSFMYQCINTFDCNHRLTEKYLLRKFWSIHVRKLWSVSLLFLPSIFFIRHWKFGAGTVRSDRLFLFLLFFFCSLFLGFACLGPKLFSEITVFVLLFFVELWQRRHTIITLQLTLCHFLSSSNFLERHLSWCIWQPINSMSFRKKLLRFEQTQFFVTRKVRIVSY